MDDELFKSVRKDLNNQPTPMVNPADSELLAAVEERLAEGNSGVKINTPYEGKNSPDLADLVDTVIGSSVSGSKGAEHSVPMSAQELGRHAMDAVASLNLVISSLRPCKEVEAAEMFLNTGVQWLTTALNGQMSYENAQQKMTANLRKNDK